MLTSQSLDSASATIIAAAVGAAAALIATFITLLVTRWLDDRRWRREREHRETIERRAAYAKVRRTMVVWREATVELEGEPTPEQWRAYWAARDGAMQAGAELEMIGTPLALEVVDEALDELLDVSWDYEHNGPWATETGPLWKRMEFIDARIAAFRDLARAEFNLDPAVEDPRGWLDTPELVRREVDELRRRRTDKPKARKELPADAESRRQFEAGKQYARRQGTIRRLVYSEGLEEEKAKALVDGWEQEARRRKLKTEAPDYWVQAEKWMLGEPPDVIVLPGENLSRDDQPE